MTGRYHSKVTLSTVMMALFLSVPIISPAAEFSADYIKRIGGDKEASKVFVKGKMRREEMMDDGEISAINISRPDKGVMWNLVPEEKMYMEIPLGGMPADGMVDVNELESRAKMKLLGMETLSGYVCEKRQYEDQAGGSIIVWYSPKLDHPVKIHINVSGGENEMIMEYKDIKTGKIPDSKFEIPRDYQKFAIPGMPAGMPPGMPPGMPGGMPRTP